MKRFFSYMKAKEWLLFAAFVVFVLAQVALSLRMPDYMSGITESLQSADMAGSDLLAPGLSMLGCAAGSVICAVAAGFCLSHVTAAVSMRMREGVFEKIMSFSMAEMSGFSASSLIMRCTNDVMQVQNFSTIGLQVFIQGPITAVFAIAKMGGNRVWLTTVAVVIALILIVHIIVIAKTVPKSLRIQKLLDQISRVTREHLSGMRVIHAYNGYAFQKKQFDGINRELTDTSIRVNKTIGVISPFLTFFTNGMSLFIYMLGAMMILQSAGAEKLTLFSQMVVFSSYALQAIMAFILMLLAVVEFPRALVSLKRIGEVMDTRQQIADGRHETGANGEIGSIEFRDVSFTYPGAATSAVSHISFKAERGQTLAIIGSTGSGKTTLMNLIPRFYDATEGQVLVDGRDVRDYKIWALRDKIGYVPQKSFLFSGTIASNIDYGTKSGFQAALADIKNAAEIGQSKDFIEHKTGSYEAQVKEGGSNFSGGQRQRLTISRAVCRDPEFYLFDDSFSALDFKTDAALRKSLREHAGNATQIIVGQRIGSIMHADKILVLDRGCIVGQGTHEELMKECEIYQEIAKSQLSGEEAAS